MDLVKEPTNLRREFALGFGLWIFFAGGLSLGFIHHNQTLIVVGAGIYSYFLAIFIHELAHALTASAMGYEVIQIKLGTIQDPEGPSVDFQFLGYNWKLYSPMILAGIVRYFPCRLDHYRLRRMLVTAAGPMITGLAALPGVILFEKHHLSALDHIWLAWTYVNALLFVSSAVPSEVNRDGKIRKTDGKRLLDLFIMKPYAAKEAAIYAVFIHNTLAATKTMKSLSLAEAEKLAQGKPEEPWLHFLLLEKMNDAQQAQKFLELANLSLMPRQFIAQRIDSFLTEQLNKGLSPETTLWVELSFKLLSLNDCLTTRGTHGSVLIDLGRIEEGREMLDEVLIKSLSDFDKAYCHVFLAIADRTQGQLEPARRHAESAIKIHAQCPSLARVADLLTVAVS